jgi:MerR family transcriptional regulator, light-induced transcriptional regulator
VKEPLASLEASSPEELGQRYLECLLAPDARAARQLIDDALTAGITASSLYLQVIAPAMHEVGRLWETSQVTVAEEHLATQITQVVMAGLGLHVYGGEPVGAGRVAVVSPSPGELHSLGGQMVADFLEAQGWVSLHLGPDTPAHELVSLVHERDAEVVALSTALPGHLLPVTRVCQLLRQLPRPPFIVAGGRAYGGDPARALAIGADAFAEDPEELLSLLGRRFGPDAAH